MRGGDQGGPNLLRSVVVTSDQHGELIKPIVRGARQGRGMPAFTMPDDDVEAVAEYIHGVQANLGIQGEPPGEESSATLRVIVGHASDGKVDFAARCSGCHSIAGDLRGIGARFSEPRDLQNSWVTGSMQQSDKSSSVAPNQVYCQAIKPTISVHFATGEQVGGSLLQANEFVVTLVETDGTRRTISLDATVTDVDVRGPDDAHRQLARSLDDKTMHDLTSYLATLK